METIAFGKENCITMSQDQGVLLLSVFLVAAFGFHILLAYDLPLKVLSCNTTCNGLNITIGTYEPLTSIPSTGN
jgi:hypothetical protein